MYFARYDIDGKVRLTDGERLEIFVWCTKSGEHEKSMDGSCNAKSRSRIRASKSKGPVFKRNGRPQDAWLKQFCSSDEQI